MRPIKGFGIPPTRPKTTPTIEQWVATVYSVAVSLIRLGKTETTKTTH